MSRSPRSPRTYLANVENQWLGARPLEARSQGGASGPIGPVRGQAQGDVHQVGRDGRRVAAPSHAALAGLEPKDRAAADPGRASGRASGTGPATNRLAAASAPPKYQSTSSARPRAVPSEAIAVDQPAGAADLEVLDDSLELESLRQLAAVVAAGKPDVAPDQPGARGEFDPAALKVAAAAERNRRAGQNDQAGVILDLDGPLLGREAGHGGVNASGRLAGHDGPRALSRRDLDQMTVAVQQAGGEVDQVEQRRRLAVERRTAASRGPGPADSRHPAASRRRRGPARCVRRRPGPPGARQAEGPEIRAASGALRA